MLLHLAGDDQVVPCEQARRFADVTRAAGNQCTELIFESAVHGGGGINCVSGRQATLDFLHHHGLLSRSKVPSADDPRDAVGGALRAFKMTPIEYAPALHSTAYRPALHGRTTLWLTPTKAA